MRWLPAVHAEDRHLDRMGQGKGTAQPAEANADPSKLKAIT